jgi:non-ribosomal peptide synthase protein (TIGR01720 family)
LVDYAQSEAVQEDLAFWLARSRETVGKLPLDYADGQNTEASLRTVRVTLDEAETQALLREIHDAYRTEINDILLAALAQTLTRWTQSRKVLIELEGHGRAELFQDIDISRTVGWFTTIYPLLLSLDSPDDPGATIKAVKEQIRATPRQGLGYSLLRYLSLDDKLAAQPQPAISFNYLGQFDAQMDESAMLAPASEPRGADRSPDSPRSCLIDVTAAVSQGRLGIELAYSEDIHRRATIERVGQDYIGALRGLIAHCRAPEVGGVTASDFPLANLNQRKLDRVLGKINKRKP